MSEPAPSRYDPAAVEPRWIEAWVAERVGAADAGSIQARDRGAYSIFIPPPNVTGVLHMGHGLNLTLQDVLIRFHRMRGFETLWQPGTDHAGIATQNVVERKLEAEGRTRHDLGRDGFVKEVWRWKHEYEQRILGQIRRMGSSCDWGRLRFTMDEGLSAAVRHVFVDLYERGYIYRGLRLANWCVRCHTAISDDEVTHEEKDDHLWWLRYPLAEGDRQLTIATTRPETMLADTAVAVHPEDERYADLIGRQIRLPLVGRLIPIVGDEHVKRDFGAGALKVTPGHDPNDWEIGERHRLERICVIEKDGTLGEAAPEAYRGLDRLVARKRVLADLEEQGLVEKREPLRHSVGTCDRCHTVIEPIPSVEWFVRLRERSPQEPEQPSLAERAIAATREGRVRFVPERWTAFYMSWLENVRDWCISRQLWWGHRIPMFYCDACGWKAACRTDPPACPECSGTVRQDDDVLDTWFSSDLWPLSTLGWPEQTEELRVFYPSNVLLTDRGIIYLWVARMVMIGELYAPTVETRGGRTEPYGDVYIHGTILDKLGRKMSKSLGNGIDPLEMVELYGADAVRFTLTWMTTEGQDLKLDASRFEMGRNFMNKLWNVARFTLGALEGSRPAPAGPLEVEDRWIRDGLTRTHAAVGEALSAYQFSTAVQTVYDFLWHDFCDWYVELVKPRLQDGGHGGDAARATLAEVLTGICRMLHPVAPHVTEELWDRLRPWHGQDALLALSDWGAPEFRDAAAGGSIAALQDTVRCVRNLRAESRVPEKERVDVLVVPATPDAPEAEAVRALAAHVERLAKASSVRVEHGAQPFAETASAVLPFADVFIDLEGKIDRAAERQRLERELGKAEKALVGSERKLANENFVARAAAEVVERERTRRTELLEQTARLRARLEALAD